MRRGFGFIGLLFTVIVIAIVGVIAYQAGWSEGFAQHVPTTAVEAPGPYPGPYYSYGPHFFGFGWIFGPLFFFFLLFIVFRIGRFARWGGGQGWGHHGGGVPPVIEERMREWHQRAHGEQPTSGSGKAGTTPPPPPPVPDQRA